MKSMFAAIVGVVGFAGLAAAQAPVAVVEDVQGKVTGAEFMDYVAPGAVIKIGPAGKVVLGYMKSCWRETITGVGTVIVGADESMVHLSEIKAGKVQCDSSQTNPIDRSAKVPRPWSAAWTERPRCHRSLRSTAFRRSSRPRAGEGWSLKGSMQRANGTMWTSPLLLSCGVSSTTLPRPARR